MKENKKKQEHNALNTPISALVEGGSILQDKTKVIGAIYNKDVMNELCRRVNAYDILKDKLKEIEHLIKDDLISNEPGVIIKINDLIKKTLKEL